MNTTIKISKWALDNMTIKFSGGEYFTWIEAAQVYGAGYMPEEAVFMAIRVTLDLYDNFIEEPEDSFCGPALEMRKMFIGLFGDENDEL